MAHRRVWVPGPRLARWVPLLEARGLVVKGFNWAGNKLAVAKVNRVLETGFCTRHQKEISAGPSTVVSSQRESPVTGVVKAGCPQMRAEPSGARAGDTSPVHHPAPPLVKSRPGVPAATSRGTVSHGVKLML